MRKLHISKRNARWAKAGLLAAAAAGLFIFLTGSKAALTEQASRMLEQMLSHGTQYRVSIGRMHGHLRGYLAFENVEVSENAAEADGLRFRFKEIRLYYQWTDLFSKRLTSKFELRIRQPEVTWNPRFGQAAPKVPFIDWMRDWAFAQRSQIRVRIEDMKLYYGPEKKEFAGIYLGYDDSTFTMELPLTHLPVQGSDITTVLKAEGRFSLGGPKGEDKLSGRIVTEGTVINWKPLTEEAHFDFTLTRNAFELSSGRLLGGIEIAAAVLLDRELSSDVRIRLKNYAMSNLAPFMRADASFVPGRVDLEADLKGPMFEPRIDVRARFREGTAGGREFQVMDLNLSGVYPTVRLEGSRIMLADGTTMQFADKTLEMRELFQDKTLSRLIGESDQDTVVWGEWEFSRPLDENNRPELLAERLLGSRSRAYVKASNEDEQQMKTTETAPIEAGFEYRLRSQDSLKFNVKEDEEFVGVEHKVNF